MLTVNNVDFGLIPYGPGLGESGLLIDISKVDKADELTTLLEKLELKIKEYKLDKEWVNALNGTNSIFLLFKGNQGIEDEDSLKEWDQFNRQLSKKSIDIQLSLRLRPDQLKPPFCIWYGIPKVFSSTRNFYEYFNCIYGIIPHRDYNSMACQEIINHKFSAILLLGDNYAELNDELNSKYNLRRKLYLINKNIDAQRYCIDKCIKYNPDMSNQNFLILN